MKKLLILFLLIASNIFSQDLSLKCGSALGYPPYQFMNEEIPQGLDIDVIKEIGKNINKKITINPDNWDDVVFFLRVNKLDIVTGMEINEERKQFFSFTTPYYYRFDAIFALENNSSVNKISDLKGKLIAGDRHSHIEKELRTEGLYNLIRISHTKTKDESIKKLKSGEIKAVIMPYSVGMYLSRINNVKVKIIHKSENKTPVAIAVNKKNKSLLEELNKAVIKLKEEGKIEKIYQDWIKK